MLSISMKQQIIPVIWGATSRRGALAYSAVIGPIHYAAFVHNCLLARRAPSASEASFIQTILLST